MPRRPRERPVLRAGKSYIRVNGELVEVDPRDPSTGIPDRCKLAWAEMTTGKPHVLVDKNEKKVCSGS